MNKNIEVEGGEIAIRNSHGDLAIIPKDKRDWVKQKLSEGCHSCIDKLVETLPVMEDYAQDGSLYSEYLTPDSPTKKHPLDPNPDGSLPSYFKGSRENPIELDEVTVTAETPEWVKYRKEYVKNNPFNIDEYVENRFNNPVGREVIEKIDQEGWRKKLKQEGLEKRYNSAMDYVGEQLVKNKPQNDLSRAEWLNQMSDKEEELIKRNPKYQSSLWADTKRGLTSLVEQNPLQTFQNILNSSDYTNREKQEMLKDYIDHPIMSKLGDAAKILNPLTIPSKMVQSTYKEDYSFTDALKGKKNNAGIVEDIVTDPLNLVGVGLVGKLSKADKVIDAIKAGRNLIKPVSKVVGKTDDVTKAGSKVIGKGDDVVKLVERKQVFDKETLDAIDRYNKYFGKNDPNSTLTMADKVKIGRDVVSRNNLEKAYRNTHIEEILDARKKGYFNNEKFPDTDWYYGGSSSRYGNIEIEAIPDSKFFRLFEVDGKYAGIITRYKDVLHLKGNNVPYKGTIIRYKGKELSDDMLERISKIYKKGDNLDEIISSITK